MSASRLTLKQRFKLDRFMRGEPASVGPITLNQRRIFILPSGRGLGLLLLIVLLILIGFVYNNNLVYLLGFLLSSMFFITILHSYKALADLVVGAVYSPPVFAGDMAGFVIRIDNPSVEVREGVLINLPDQEPQLLSLMAQQSLAVTLYAPTFHRGWQDCDTITLSSGYPFGWFRVWSPLRLESRVLVYPQPAPSGQPFPEDNTSLGRQGQSRRQGDEFNGLKPYQVGDAIRQIHWKSYAKGQGLQSKHYLGSQSVDLWLSYDAMVGGYKETRLSQLCRWVIDAEQAGLRYGLVLPHLTLTPSIGNSHFAQCLQALALFE